MLLSYPDEHVKLCDFGLASRLSLAQNELLFGVRGTPRYMAPEVAFRAFNLPADVYSYGICLYELLHGARFLGHLQNSDAVLLAAANGQRPQAHLAAEQRELLSDDDGAFADTAAAVVDRCWQSSWDQRPKMVDVTFSVLLRRSELLAGIPDEAWHGVERLVMESPNTA